MGAGAEVCNGSAGRYPRCVLFIGDDRGCRSARAGGQRLFQHLATTLGLAAVLVAGSCSSSDEAFESERPRPTDVESHDHSSENSALAPETVLAGDIAELGAGVATGEQATVWLGVNVCGRFVEIPSGGPVGGLGVDAGGLLEISPGVGDPSGHEVTAGAVMDLIDLQLGTGEMSFGPGWGAQEVVLDERTVALADTTFATGDSCGTEQGEVQLWYYTPAAVNSGEELRLVVTDPQDVPVLESGTALTVAFAPSSSLPTLPPAALVG